MGFEQGHDFGQRLRWYDRVGASNNVSTLKMFDKIKKGSTRPMGR
jgi:hypothetical protein